MNILTKIDNGSYNFKRWTVSIDTSNKQIMEGIEIIGEIDCFDLCEILRLKLTGYADTLNLHIMNDGSGNFMGCICG